MFLFVFICENTPKKNHMQNEVSQKLNTQTHKIKRMYMIF